MLDAAGGSCSPASKMAPELSRRQQEQQQPESEGKHESSVAETPPRSPARNGQYAKITCDKEEDAVMSLMKLATPVKSPGCRGTISGSLGEITPRAGQAWGDGAEMTPVSIFRKSRQPGEFGGPSQSPFQSPLKSFQFSPSSLFSPPGAGTLDIPLSGGDTPGPSANRGLWQHTTPDRCGYEDVRRGVGSGPGSDGGSCGGGSVPGSCSKRKSASLFADKRGPQYHSRGLGQAWCLGTPDRASRGSGLVHLEVSDIPATPDRPTGADGAQVLPPTPRLLPPTPLPRSLNDAVDAAGGDDAAGILMGLRSPESVSSYNGGGGGSGHPLFNSMNDDGNPGMMERSWSHDWENRKMIDTSGSGGCGIGDGGGSGAGVCSSGGGIAKSGGLGQGGVPHTAPVKRHKKWTSSAVSLRDAHCKGSFTIEGGTLIRSTPGSSPSGAGKGSGNSSGSNKKGSCKKKRGTGGGTKRNAPSRVKNYEQNIFQEPSSPPKPVFPPEPEPLIMSRRLASLSPAKTPAAARKEINNRGPSTAPRLSSARGARGDRGRKGAVSEAVENATASAVTPSPAAAAGAVSSSVRSRPAPRVALRGASARAKARVDSASINNPELSSSAPSQRRGRSSSQKQKKAESDDGESSVTSMVGAVGVEGELSGQERTTCNCKKSKCLKLYCECFQRRLYCVADCKCMECLNTGRTEDLRQVAIQSTIERNPQAFESKFERRAGKRSHNAGCNCKKSACLKKYCECFQAGVACGSNCKCSNCKNYEGAAGGRKRRATETLPPRTPLKVAARGRGAAAATTPESAAVAAGPRAESTAGEDAYHVSVFDVPAGARTDPNQDHHVQVGDEDYDDSELPSPLVDALRARAPAHAVDPPFYATAATPDEARDDSGSCSSGSGGGDPSDTPAAPAAHMNRSSSSAMSPAASALADLAVSKSVLDMGLTPLQFQKGEAGADSKFELSVANGTPGGVLALSARLNEHQQQGRGGELRGSGEEKGLDGNTTVGMDALLSRARRDAFERGPTRDSVAIATADNESVGDGTGGFVASSRGKAGGQACFTPPNWEEMRPGFDGVDVGGADPGSVRRPYGVKREGPEVASSSTVSV